MDFSIFNNDNSGKYSRENYLKKHNIEIYDYIIKWCDDRKLNNLKFSLKVYHCINNIIEIPKCKICSSDVKFKNKQDGYNKYCSVACMNKDKDIVLKRKETNKRLYGVENPRSLDVIKKKTERTNMRLYGHKSPMQNETIKNKSRNTLLKIILLYIRLKTSRY